MSGAGSTETEAEAIVYNSHTPATDLGMILSLTNPRLGVTTHTPIDPRSIESLIMGVRTHWPDGAYQVGADLMVFNVIPGATSEETTVTTRMAAPVERPWPVRIEEAPSRLPPPLERQLDDYRSGVTIDHTGDSDGPGSTADHEVNIFEQVRYLPADPGVDGE